ncbi:pentatricopeptide repeat-containing protein, putative [Ixodes scapularis]|uniref:Pentatricopeptide repeat-containing protein, putative n=1 Tax=Ixodes scapularis TaxID=6945 RepID=B7QLZ7_IXOSC|nr:pentatricopeptide repeat-containing protein, putative [Ixodes scapularis]|eukprot:XP_002416202.1 pentatricopeptide repeat-containing protein, putative [Ixodes scapularis]
MFTMLIGGCGRVGYTKMAFKLFKSMRDRAMDPTPAVLTGLFNACAEAPFRELGLEKAQLLYDRIQLKGWLPSNITYHAMIKAFGRCGDIEMAFKIMDEMAAQKHAITTETFAFLLMACISDKQAGFTLGLKVMRQMLWKKIRPSIYCYNLFLRTVRECGVGPPELFQELLDSAKPKPNLSDSHGAGGKKEPKAKTLLIKARVLEDGISSTVADEPIVAEGERSQSKTVSSLHTTSRFHTGRLMVCGGVLGIMDHLRDMCVRPDAKTITLLLDCLPADCDSEVELIAEADKMGVKLDVDFFNMLIKRRALRGDREQARDVLELIRSRGLHPDVITFGVTALSVFSKKEGREFLDSMKAAGLRVNEETWGTLVNNACYRFNFWFLLDLMRFGEQEGIAVSTTALRSIGKADAKMRQMLLKKEKGTTSRFVTEASESGYAEFRKVYDAWLKNTKMDLPRHPWEQYEPENMRKSIAELKEEAQQKTEKT